MTRPNSSREPNSDDVQSRLERFKRKPAQVTVPTKASHEFTGLDPDPEEIPLGSDLDQWAVALQWSELKKRSGKSDEAKLKLKHLRTLAIRAVLMRARTILGSVVKPEFFTVEEYRDGIVLPASAELEIEDSFDSEFERLFFEIRKFRDEPLVLAMDTSLSMTGEKLAWAAVALAVVALQFSQGSLAVVTFQNDATVLKTWNERLTVERLLERFFDLDVEGYTHLEAGLEKALELARTMVARSRGRRIATLLLTDGKYTAGRNPMPLASLFPRLVVLKVGSDGASRDFCLQLARESRSRLLEVDQDVDLPRGVAQATREILRLS